MIFSANFPHLYPSRSVFPDNTLHNIPYSFTLYIEAAANGMFGAGKGGLINPPDPAREFPLILAEVAVLDQDVSDLLMDMTLLYDMSKVGFPANGHTFYQCML